MTEFRGQRPMKQRKSDKFFDILGEIVAIITIISYALLIIDANWAFIPANGIIYTILICIKTYGLLALLVLVSLEAIAKRNFIIKIVFLVLIAVVIIFQFFPGTWDSVVGTINSRI